MTAPPPVVVSPHLDDGALSCGQLVGGYPGTVVATVMAAEPADWHMATTHDSNSGFRNAREAMTHRRQEDQRAVSMMGGRTLWGPFTDSQYGEAMPEAGAITDWLLATWDEHQPRFVVGPLGLAHQDHQLVAQAFAAALLQRPALQGWVYEELPSRVLWPETVATRVHWWNAAAGRLVMDNPGGSVLHRKARALREYKSQLRTLDWHALLVPERYYRVDR